MGFELDRFNTDVDLDLTCSLCHKVLEDPLTTPCGHVFCAGCVIPWVAQQSSCPAKCQRVNAKELNQVLPLKNFILKLDIKCDNHEKGCKRIVKLQHLSEHVKSCEFSPSKCRNKGCNAVLNPRDMSVHILESCEFTPVEVCENGCGLMVVLKEKKADNHCCLNALKAHNDALKMKITDLERGLKRQSLKSSKREKSLWGQLSAFLNELQVTKRRFQKEISEYKARIDSLVNGHVYLSKANETKSLRVTLHRESGSLGFSLIGGRSCGDPEDDSQVYDGIYVSKILENGPADREGGLCVYDRIMEVNGRNVAHATHEEAVEAFRTASEPLEVLVLRHTTHSMVTTTLSPQARGVDSSTQTDITLQHIEALSKCPASTVALRALDLAQPRECQISCSEKDYCSGHQKSMQTGLGRGQLEHETAGLHRKTSQDKLGLTLCYRTESNKIQTDVYVSEIDPKGIAAKDGRVRTGDQIIQVNAVDSHEDAVGLLSREDSRNVCSLLARRQAQLDDEWLLQENRDHFLDHPHMDVLEPQEHQAMLQQEGHEDDDGTTDTILSNHLEKDSGVGRTDESTRNDENSEQENIPDDQSSASFTMGTWKSLENGLSTLDSSDIRLTNESYLSVDHGDGEFPDIPEMECERFRELLELKYLVNGTCGSARHSEEMDSLDYEDEDMELLNEELRNVELECLSIIQAQNMQEIQDGPNHWESLIYQDPLDQTRTERHHHRLKEPTGVPPKMHKDTSRTNKSSTGQNIFNTKLTLERTAEDSLSTGTEDQGKGSVTHRLKPSTAQLSKHHLSHIQKTNSIKTHLPSAEPEATNQLTGKDKHFAKPGSKHFKSSHSHSPYKYALIPAHAQHYQSYMQLIQQKSAVEYAQSQASLASFRDNLETSTSSNRPKQEWKVKIRSDGTRYITKKPSREQLLRERALRIKEERSGMTTDDDAVSELKMGRYWNRAERRQHVIQARERRDFMKQTRLCNEKEQGGSRAEKKEPDIIQLSHRKMMRKRNKKILDNWMTIQELLTHGMKSPDGTCLDNALLSVTAV
ncbi:E3 ubiquitin-protein ligase PDZRN3-B [Chanos chanos]|uniref:E3 ubiquitin-protein ligase PDZRN3-B n=1 Tax=Chanos chanos TaxID=29144 RepID=A0A6J2UVE1_CHACN|nr:E3 ubiquitin-protein ligase PDZRN3-B-like [Chanos chanos]